MSWPRKGRRLAVAALFCSAFAAPLLWPVDTLSAADDGYHFNDAHFHLTNYVQKGLDIRDYLALMGDRVGRSAHVYFDISWDEVAKYAISSPESEKRTAELLNRFPERFLFGTDVVAPPNQAASLRVFELWSPIFAQLNSETSLAVRKKNYERLFDAARVRARAWEKTHLH